MIVLKDFKNVNQVFKAGDEIYENIEGLEHYVAAEFVALEQIVDGKVTPVAVTPVIPTATPTVTFA
jgi:hypothetical protein